jgi:hypothetical protein
LKDKSLVHDNLATRGRYEGFALIKQDDTWRAKDKRDNDLDTFPVFQMDVWMADPKVQSTVGVPTPKNVEEIVNFAFQLHLLSQGKGTWTSAGHLVRLLRRDGWIPDLAQSYGNPFLLGVDALALLRQVIALDGFMIRELLRVLLEKTPHSNGALVTRDDIVKDFVSLVGKSDRGASKLFSCAGDIQSQGI